MIRHLITRGFLAVGFILLGISLFVLERVMTHNEGVVEAGRVYRSAQLDGPALRQVIARYGIKTIINLRGENARSGWYRDELEACRSLGVHHVDVKWSAQHLPPPREVSVLLQAYHQMPYPILLHCRSGADRTGLAAAIYLIDRDQVPWQSARRTLSWTYGHFGIYPYFEMDEFVQLYGQSDGKPLATWVAQDYPSVYADEMMESKMDEVFEPLELAIRGSL